MGGNLKSTVRVADAALIPLSSVPRPVSSRASAKILRPPFPPLRLAKRLAAILSAGGSGEAGNWVLAAAQGQAVRTRRRGFPKRWLARLAAAFPRRDAARIPFHRDALEEALPEAAWFSPALLGEVLLAARHHAAARSRAPRKGRAGRRSTPGVYTPPELARRMIATLQVGPKRVLDPACGAGAFLLAAFQRAFKRRVEGGQAPREAARRVLAHELSGVDHDAQALALAEFSLRAAAWEAAGVAGEVPLDLRCADALEKLSGLEARAEVVVGNPPFVEGRGLSQKRLAALRARFRCAASGKVNLFAVFVERGLELLQAGGVLSFVLPGTFQRNERYRALRELLLGYTLESIEPVPPATFEGRAVETVILRVRKQPPARAWRVTTPGGTLLQRRLPLGPSLRFCARIAPAQRRQMALMERHGVPLSTCFEVRDGISTGFQPFPERLLGRVEKEAGKVRKYFVAADGTRVPFDRTRHRPVIGGSAFAAFTPVRWDGRWIEYDKRHEHHPPHPGRPFNCQLRDRAIFDRPEKVLSRQTATGLITTVDRARYFARNSVHVLYARESAPSRRRPGETFSGISRVSGCSLAALCACLNSRFYNDYFLAATGEDGALFPQVHIADLKRLPILPGLLRRGGPLGRLGEELLKLHDSAHPDAAARIERGKADVEALLCAAFGCRDTNS